MAGEALVGRPLDRYLVQAVIGAGGFAVVYRAVDTALERTVALKVLDPAAHRDPTIARRFVLEGRAVASLDHPAVVPVYDAGDHDGLLWMAMRLVEGGTVDQALASGRRFRPEEVVAVVQRIGSALDHAHSRGIVHRDVKPSNLLLEGDEPHRAHLADFGIAATARSVGRYTTGALGTAAYMAPEQARPSNVGPPADVYSLACVAYEMLAGRRPFPGDDYVALLYAHATHPVPPVGDPAVDAVLSRALAKTPGDRPPTCSVLARELRDALLPTDLPVSNTPAAATSTDGVALAQGTAAPSAAAVGGAAPPGSVAGSPSPAMGPASASGDHLPAGHAPIGTPDPASDEVGPATVAPASASGGDPSAGHASVGTQSPASEQDAALVPGWVRGGDATRVEQPEVTLVQPPSGGAGGYPSGTRPGWPATAGPGHGHPGGMGMSRAGEVRDPTVMRVSRRGARQRLVAGGLALLVAVVTTVVVLQMQGSPDRRVRDAAGISYELASGWELGPVEPPTTTLRDGEADVATITHGPADAEAVMELAGMEPTVCQGEPAAYSGIAGADHSARCDNPEGVEPATAIAALAGDRLWIITVASGVASEDREAFLDSIRLGTP